MNKHCNNCANRATVYTVMPADMDCVPTGVMCKKDTTPDGDYCPKFLHIAKVRFLEDLKVLLKKHDVGIEGEDEYDGHDCCSGTTYAFVGDGWDVEVGDLAG